MNHIVLLDTGWFEHKWEMRLTLCSAENQPHHNTPDQQTCWLFTFPILPDSNPQKGLKLSKQMKCVRKQLWKSFYSSPATPTSSVKNKIIITRWWWMYCVLSSKEFVATNVLQNFIEHLSHTHFAASVNSLFCLSYSTGICETLAQCSRWQSNQCLWRQTEETS